MPKRKSEIERRSYTVEEVRFQEEGTIFGYAAVFNQPTEIGNFLERIQHGAFTKTLRENPRIKALWNHDPTYVLGNTGAGTLRVWEDDHGLAVEIDPPQTPLADHFVESVRRGDVEGMSFAFKVVKDAWTRPDKTGRQARTIEEVRLLEVSLTPFPAYEGTSAQVRSEEDETHEPPEEHSPRLLRVMVSLGELFDKVR